jgi:hypothetical protein
LWMAQNNLLFGSVFTGSKIKLWAPSFQVLEPKSRLNLSRASETLPLAIDFL